MFAIVVAFGVFVISWNSRQISSNGWLCLLGISSLFVGGLDLVHTLAYRGMGVFQTAGANLPMQLWLAARHLQAASFLVAPFLIGRRLPHSLTFLTYLALTMLLLLSIFYFGTFPPAYEEGAGLTPFEMASEYAITATLVLSAYPFFRRRGRLDRDVLRLLVPHSSSLRRTRSLSPPTSASTASPTCLAIPSSSSPSTSFTRL